jgi:cation diffusion facilitator family transporter
MISAIRLTLKPTHQKPLLSHHRRVNQVLWQVLILNLTVAAAKVIVGMLIGSISMLADGFHSAMDASSNIIGIIGSSLAGRPPDSDHPYGHYKYETFATLGIGLLLLLTSWNVLKSIFTRLADGTAPEITTLSFAVMIATIALNLAVVLYEKRQGRRLQSALLLADAAHTKSDIFVSLSVLISLAAVRAGWVWIDAVTALLIVGIIGRTGWQIVRRASDVLADSAIVDPTAVEKIVLGIEGVKSCHKIRSRGCRQAAHLDLHIQVDGQMTLEQAHQLGHITQRRLKQTLGIADVMVHVEPVLVAYTP